MFPINFNFPYRKKDGSLITMEKALDGAGADLDLIDLDDVAITSPAEGDGLIYDNTAHKWKNIPIISRIVALFNAWKNNGAYNICPNEATSGTVNQVTYTVNSNGTVTAAWSEAPTGNSPLLYSARGSLKLKAGVTYKLVGCPAGGAWAAGSFKYRVFIQDNTAGTDIQDTGTGAIFTAVEGHKYTVYITIAQHAGATGSLVFKPMVTTDLNATYDDYEPYAKTNGELTEDTRKIVTIIDTMPTTATNKPVGGCPVGYVLIGADVYNVSDNRWDSMPVGVLPDRPCYITSYSDSTTTYARPYLEPGGVTAYGGQTFRAQFMRVN